MAWSGSDISTAKQTYFSEDKPILGGTNALDSPQSAKWATTANGSDIVASGFPISRAYDRLGHLRTKPNTSGTEFWLQVQLNASHAIFDCVCVWGHAGMDGVTLAARIADDAAYTTNAEEIATTTVSGTQRVAFLDLQDSGASVSQRYSTVPYFWLRMTKGASFTPEIGEIWLFRRVAMPHFPRLSWDPDAWAGDAEMAKSRSGVAVSYVNHHGRQDLDASFNHADSTIDAAIKTFRRDHVQSGTRPFVWIYQPSSKPEEFRVIMPSGEPIAYPYVGWAERQITFSGTECYPFQNDDAA